MDVEIDPLLMRWCRSDIPTYLLSCWKAKTKLSKYFGNNCETIPALSDTCNVDFLLETAIRGEKNDSLETFVKLKVLKM